MDAPVMGAFATLVQAGFPPRPVLDQALGDLKATDFDAEVHMQNRHKSEWGTIQAIGHITENRWFDPKVLADEFDVGPIGR